MMLNPVGWFEIYVKDMQRAKTFYQKVFKKELSPLPQDDAGIEMWAFPMSNEGYGATGALVYMPGMPCCESPSDATHAPLPSQSTLTLVYFSCVDCAHELSLVLENGGTVCKDKFSIGQYGFAALVLDTEGNMLGLHSMQ